MPKNKRMYFQTEIVKGECPTCNQITTLVGVSSQFYRCMECGGDLEQHVNGKISYLPIMSKRDDGGIPFVKEWKQIMAKKSKYMEHAPRDKPRKRPGKHKKSLNKAEKRQQKN